MAIPDYQAVMLPLLKMAGDGRDHRLRDAVEVISNEFNLTEEERKALLPSGINTVILNRVGWARTYLKKSGLLELPRRGYFRITQRGETVLSQNPERIDSDFLMQFPEYVEFRGIRRLRGNNNTGGGGAATKVSDTFNYGSEQNPVERLELAYEELNQELASELLETISNASPRFFEKLVIDLLIKMGYGGSRKDAGQAIGRSGDEGIDGIIKEDRLGLDVIYVQAKRWQIVVGRPEIQRFAGALQGQRARKGIFITTSRFTVEASDYAASIDTKIILVDGTTLAKLMIEHNVGVSVESAYEVKKVDADYFEE